MFDIAPSEFLLVAFVALVVIGPKDLPKAMRVLGYWVGRARAVGRQVRSGFDEMVREAELEEMEKKWKAENERIMREHPLVPSPPAEIGHRADDGANPDLDATGQPVMVEKPQVSPADLPAPAIPIPGDIASAKPDADRPVSDSAPSDSKAAS